MCALFAIALLLFGGWFGFSTLTGIETSAAPPTIEAQAATAVAAVPTQAFSCAAPAPDVDVTNMLTVVGSVFNADSWTRQMGGDGSKNTATWTASDLGAVAYLEYLHYDCGVTDDQIDAYYSPDGFNVLLENYQSHQKTAECFDGGLRLYEFNVVWNDTRYLMRYWVKQISPTRVAGVMLVFPDTEPAKLAAYAGRLFPQLPTCAAAAG